MITFLLQDQEQGKDKDPLIILNLRNGNNVRDIGKALQRMCVNDNSAAEKERYSVGFEALGKIVAGMFDNEGIETNGRFLVLFTSSTINMRNSDSPGNFKEVRLQLTEKNINTLLVDFGKNNVGKIDGVSDKDEDKDIFQQVVFVRRDDLQSVLPFIMDGISKAKKDNSKILFFCRFTSLFLSLSLSFSSKFNLLFTRAFFLA